MCPKCHTLYNFDYCYELVCGRKVTKKCTFVQFPTHRQHFRRTKCGEPLLKEVSLKSGGTKLYPHKVYCYNSIIDNLCQFLQRPGFVDKCELWRSRGIPDGFLADIFDGRIWKEWQNLDGKAFFAAQRNYAFMLNVDWFQPFKHCSGCFTADQWKSFTVLFSIHALWNALPSSDMEVWRNFVMACSCLCSTVLTETKALLAHSYLLKFCQGFE